MRAQIKLLQSRLATTVLYVTHDQEEAMALSSRVVVMNQGRIEQIGRPDAVYERPLTRFVQDFVGKTIRLRGVIKDDTSPLRIRIGGCEIEAPGPDHTTLRSGDAVEVSMRPEDVRLRARASPGDNSLAGRIAAVTYYGDRLECVIHIDGLDEQPVVLNAEKRQRAALNDRVFLAIDGAQVKIWQL